MIETANDPPRAEPVRREAGSATKGLLHSAALTSVERLHLDAARQRLVVEIDLVDPEFFKQPFPREANEYAASNLKIEPFNCSRRGQPHREEIAADQAFDPQGLMIREGFCGEFRPVLEPSALSPQPQPSALSPSRRGVYSPARRRRMRPRTRGWRSSSPSCSAPSRRSRITASRRISTRASRSASPARSPSTRRATRTATSTFNAVDENGKTQEYVCESHGVTQLTRNGITPQILKVGHADPRHRLAVAAQPVHVLLRQRRVRRRARAERQRPARRRTGRGGDRWRSARTSSAPGCWRRSPTAARAVRSR